MANLFLHYVFDLWVEKNWAGIQFERYADDIVCHCASEREAKRLKTLLDDRFNQCGLTLHPVKTKIAYCKGSWNKASYDTVSFDFLGYTFRPRWIKTKQGQQGLYFIAAVSQKSAKRIRQEINRWPWKYWRQKELTDIRRYCQSRLKGWLSYYGLFGMSIIRNVLFHFDKRLSRWAKAKYKKLRTLMQAAIRINRARKRNPSWFPHWSGVYGMMKKLDRKSRMKREFHVRFCERPKGRFLWPTRPLPTGYVERSLNTDYPLYLSN